MLSGFPLSSAPLSADLDIDFASGGGGAGRSRRRPQRKYVVAIDGEDHLVETEAQAQELLEQVKEQAETTAALALDRAKKAKARPARKILQDARRALETPQITVPPDFQAIANQVLASVSDLYADTFRSIEIELALRRAEEDDDEEVLLMLL